MKENFNMREELLKGLTVEQIQKVRACKSSEELLALAKEEGIQLTDEQLAAVNGGWCSKSDDKDESEQQDTNKPPLNNPF